MAQGYFNKLIALELNISEQTIKNHIIYILRKLDANTCTQVVTTTLKRGFITLSQKSIKSNIIARLIPSCR